MTKIDGKQLAITIKDEIAEEVAQLKAAGGKTPHLAAVLVGADPASQVYVRNKVCLLYTSPSPRDATLSRMPSSA